METLLQQLSANKSLSSLEPGGPEAAGDAGASRPSAGNSPSDVDVGKDTLPSSDTGASTTRSSRFMPRVEDQSIDLSDEEADFQLTQLKHSFKHMNLSDRFFGKSSGARLIKSALDSTLR